MTDANVLIAGVAWPRWPYEVLMHASRQDFTLVLCPRIIQEAERRLHQLHPDHVATLHDILEQAEYESVLDADPEEVAAQSGLLRDATDLPVAVAAINARVDFFLTHDRDFTDRDASTEELHRRLMVLLPAAFLREHLGWSSEALEAIRRRTWADLANG